MKDKKGFYNLLMELDGQPIAEYRQLIGDFDFSRYTVKCTHIDIEPGEVICPVFVIRIPQTVAEIPEYLFDSALRRTAMEDLFLRHMAAGNNLIMNYDRSGISRQYIHVSSPNQKILPRNALLLTKEYLEVRIRITLPLRNVIVDGTPEYSIDGAMAQRIFFEDLPEMLCNSLLYCNINVAEAEKHVNCMEDADWLRQHLGASGEVSFIAEGSIVARQSGKNGPDGEKLRPIEVDESLQEEVEAPHRDAVRGLGIPAGLTLILGGSDSGRVELMEAISQGIYNHVLGDGREQVVTVPHAVYIRSEEGRSIQQVDISAFASELPDGGDPASYSSQTADAFASQAAFTVEALEVGARVLLFDEQSSSSTFLSPDTRVGSLLGTSSYNTLAACARQMVDELGISMIVAGSSLVAEFIPIADKVLKIEHFRISDITEEAKMLDIVPAAPVDSGMKLTPSMINRSRWIMPSSIDPSIGREDIVIKNENTDFLQFGRSTVNLSEIRQIAHVDQIRTIGFIFYYAKLRYIDEGYSLREILDLVDRDLSNDGINTLVRDIRGDLARPRRYEVAAALNRLPSFRVSHVTE